MTGVATGFRAVALGFGLLGLSLAAPGLGPSSAQAQQAQDNSAEIAFWNSIKDSKTSAEFEAYLSAFPNGLFAPLARVRMQQLASGTQSPSPQQAQPVPAMPQNPAQNQPRNPPSQPEQQAEVPLDTTDRQAIADVQNRLYNLNYQVARFDGVYDTSTREAIRQWQQKINVTANGVMTQAQYQRLRASKLPAVWGSIAYVANGTYGYTWNRASRQEAEEVAINECRKRAGRRAQCDTLSAGDSACLALATYRAQTGGTVYYGARVSLQPELGRAIANALEQCEQSERSRGTCVNKMAFCGDGSHKR